MHGKEVLYDLLETQHKAVNGEFGRPQNEPPTLSEDAFNWRPDPAANSIAVTLWHLARVADFVLTHRLEGRPVEEQHWFSDGWAANTGYDPRGIGAGGMGILTGYTQAEVAALPPMSGDQLMSYHTSVYSALLRHLKELPEELLGEPAPGEGNRRSHYFWYRVILLDATRHLGELQALKAMWQRRQSG